MLQSLWEVLPQEEERRGQPVRGVRLYRPIGSCVFERLPEELDRDVLVAGIVVDPGKPTEGSCTCRPRLRDLDCLGEERLRVSGVTRLEKRRARLNSATMGGLDIILGR
jgi:hypothetical protein